jgi:hypothetical protein
MSCVLHCADLACGVSSVIDSIARVSEHIHVPALQLRWSRSPGAWASNISRNGYQDWTWLFSYWRRPNHGIDEQDEVSEGRGADNTLGVTP